MSVAFPKISIIVPVYNVECYLGPCIDSVINQTYKEWELLLIDDGSLDSSGKICENYSQSDDRIRFFHKNNGGVSSARNIGLDYAKGSFVMFLDSDDYIAPNTLEICAREIVINKLDVLQFAISRQLGRNEHDEVLDSIKGPHEYLILHKDQFCIGGTVIRLAIIEKSKIRFLEKIKLAEDQLFIIECIANSRRIKKIDNVLYYYRYRIESASNTVDIPSMIMSCKAITNFKRRYPESSYTLNTTMLQFVCLSLSRSRENQIPNIKELFHTAAIHLNEPVKFKYKIVNLLLSINFNVFSWIIMKFYYFSQKYTK